MRLHQTAFGAWLDTVVGDFVNVLMILAVGFALWRHGGTYLDMKMALAAAAMTLFYVAVSYRELMRQGEGDVMKLRWWFAYGQTLKNVSGAGSTSIRGVMLLGRRDFVIVLAIGLAYYDQLPIVLLYLMIIAIVRAAGALGQLFTPDWRIRPPLNGDPGGSPTPPRRGRSRVPCVTGTRLGDRRGWVGRQRQVAVRGGAGG